MTYQRLCQFANISSLPDPSDKYKLDERIGEGTYGEVFRAFDLETGNMFVFLILVISARRIYFLTKREDSHRKFTC